MKKVFISLLFISMFASGTGYLEYQDINTRDYVAFC